MLESGGREYKARLKSQQGSGHHRPAVVEFDNPGTKEVEVGGRGSEDNPIGGNVKISLAVVILAMLVAFPSCKKEEKALPVLGNKAPSFTLKDTDGKSVRLSDFSGRVVVMEFWATWCGPCKESSVELEKLYRKYKDRGVVVLGISMDSGSGAAQKVKGYAERNDLTYLMLMDDGKASDTYIVYNIPATYILDKNHIIIKIYKGYMPGLGDRIDEQTKQLL